MDSRQQARILTARHLADPVVEAREHAEKRRDRHHVVEMGDHEVGIVPGQVQAGVGQRHPGDAADDEQKDEAAGEQHRGAEIDGTAPHGGQPTEDLDAGGHGDDQRRGDEISPRIGVQAGRVHMVRPYHEADDADENHGIGHAQVPEDRLPGEGGDHLADDAEGRNDDDVDFRMAEEPEQMLPEDRIAAARHVEERGAEITVGEQHGQRPGQHRHR